MTPPNVLGAPNPWSSVMMSNTLGAPFGGTMRGAHQGVDSDAFSLITPPNFGSGGGSCFPSMVVVAPGDPGVPVICWEIASVVPNVNNKQTETRRTSRLFAPNCLPMAHLTFLPYRTCRQPSRRPIQPRGCQVPSRIRKIAGIASNTDEAILISIWRRDTCRLVQSKCAMVQPKLRNEGVGTPDPDAQG
jgi:hypothetical protein